VKSSNFPGADLKERTKHNSSRSGGQSGGSIQGRVKSLGEGPEMKCENKESRLQDPEITFP